MRVWRLTRMQHRQKALDGVGAALFAGRWNPAGTRVAYCTSSLELAVLEGLVQARPEELMAARFCWIEFSLPDAAVETPARLPRRWNSPGPYDEATQAIGLEWARAKRSLCLRVPSAVLPELDNILINPAHAQFGGVVEVASAPFSWPGRLLSYLQSAQEPSR